ncbi:hypothetical protein [Paraburkholderia sp. Cpub6]|uniref:hypothetical protein n=1 Tax=Paraburkholderia sp. Cpub6 TaxID=2723094 RepID=UPI001612A0CF|nr:hypothetical protein [Paraburkholderia sp. Cpub6]MBB5457696.1 hypothetical protein [Paraburkholderia sp. Cpub6]
MSKLWLSLRRWNIKKHEASGMPATAEQITRLCDDWLAAVTQPGGGMAIGGASERFRLHKNGVNFHEIEFDALCAAIVGLTKVVLLPGLTTVVDADHQLLWSWCAEVLLCRRADVFQPEQSELRELLSTAIHCALVTARNPGLRPSDWHREALITQIQSVHVQELTANSLLTLTYLAFPVLEGLIKLKCTEFVDMSGRVLAEFEVPRRGGESGRLRAYRPEQRGNGQCNSIRDLLMLYRARVAGEAAGRYLDEIFGRLVQLEDKPGPDALADWRNSSLHGAGSFPTIAGTVMGCALLIATDGIAGQYVELRQAALDGLAARQRMPVRFGNTFYPPW